MSAPSPAPKCKSLSSETHATAGERQLAPRLGVDLLERDDDLAAVESPRAVVRRHTRKQRAEKEHLLRVRARVSGLRMSHHAAVELDLQPATLCIPPVAL